MKWLVNPPSQVTFPPVSIGFNPVLRTANLRQVRARLRPLLSAAALALAGGAAAIGAEGTAPSSVVLAVDGINMVRNLPVLVAQHAGCFAAEGLTVALKETSASAEIDQQMLDGTITGMVAYYHHTIVAQMDEHRQMEAIITMGAAPGYQVLVGTGTKQTITSGADLKGKRIVTGGPHSAKTTSANWLLIHAGFTPADYTPLGTGDKNEIARLLQSGEADLVVAPEADAERYLARKVARPFADLCSAEGTRKAFGSVFPSTVLYLSTPYVEGHPALAQHLVNAFAAALVYINHHSPAEIAELAPELAKGDASKLSVLAAGMKMFATDGRMPADAAAMEAKVVGIQFPQYQGVDVAKTFTNRFVDAVRP